ncbi:GNAT family N-acetyltransferase [Flavivirga amylovorans]|uniref:GNAT family N-acetyltransferase n=1 Tax=Flavivirga amylovorans TaxID=870486 RepID=A0ABT8X1S0_9FLAO|nr:GNAT family N-acetyltransferase [Flavivirga amylovorans]MDO5987888.1 GNAT family N-acetyltransferase [Flavivirga amylovorans]
MGEITSNNPYLLDTFRSVWLNHFGDGEQPMAFSFVNSLTFIKHKKLPIYHNTGMTNTKGINYKLSNSISNDFKGKVFIICDVQGFINENNLEDTNLGCYRVKQYPGYICDLKDYNSLQDYMLGVISKKSRYKFNSYKRKLESSYKIHYRMYIDNITPELYENLFSHFKRLLKKRFFDKKTVNNNLNPDEWAFYKEVTLPMILNKEAGLFVVYDDDKPIAITLLNFSKNKMVDVMRVFDIDYSKFRLGTVSIMKQLEWCIKNNFEALDFSKGYYEYKKRWANKPYWFEHHIYYDKSSLIAKILATLHKLFFAFKLFLRKKHITNYIHELNFFLNKKKYAE